MSPAPEKTAHSPTNRTQRDLFAWSLLAGLMLFAALAIPFWAGRIYTADDLGAFHLPARAFYAEQLSRQEAFDWMPQLYSGFYLTGEGQAGTYHPLHLLLYRTLPLPAALAGECLAAYPFMLAGTWFFLRRRLRQRAPAMFGSLLFTFCGFNLLHFLHPNAVAVVAHIPWLLWAFDIVLTDPRPRKVAAAQAAIALLTGSQLLLGYPQYVWFSLMTELAYAGFLLANRPGRNDIGRPAVRIISAKGFGVLLGGVQLLPTADALAHSTRTSADAAFAAWGSLHPLNLLQLLAPYMFVNRVVGQNTHELGLYSGAVALMLVVWLFVGRRKLGRLGALAMASAVFGLLSVLLAFGEYGPLYRWQHYLPLVGHFRFPCRYLVLFQLAVAVMASIGFVVLGRDYRQSRRRHGEVSLGEGIRQWRSWWRRFGPLWTVVAGSAAVAVGGLALRDQPWIASIPAVLAGPVLLATAAVLVALAAGGVRVALIGLILFAAADLGVYGLSYAVYPHTARLDRFIARAAKPPAEGDGRVAISTLPLDKRTMRSGNQITLAGWHRADGYAGLEPQRQLDYSRLSALRVAGVRWVKRTEATAKIKGLIGCDGDWLQVPHPLPRVRLVGRAELSHDPGCDIERIDVESTALVETPLNLSPTTPGTAQLVAERPGRLHIRCNGSRRQLLVVAESFHGGWQAIVDGRRQEVLRVNGDFMGCLLEAEEQQVVFEFRPRSLHRGWLASCLGLSLIIGCWSLGSYKKEPQPRGDNSRDATRRGRFRFSLFFPRRVASRLLFFPKHPK